MLIVILEEKQIPYVIIGGAALQLIYGVASVRATADVDTVILVDTWDEYHTLLDTLKARGGEDDPEHEYRLRIQGCIIDLLPCPIREIRNDRLVLPRSRGVLSAVGWVEALMAAREIEIDPIGRVRIPPPEHLAALKASAWYERGETRDAHDFVTLCRQFGDADAIIARVGASRATSGLGARAALLGTAVQAAVPAAVKPMRALAESLVDPRSALSTRLWVEFAHHSDADEFREDMAAVGRHILQVVV